MIKDGYKNDNLDDVLKQIVDKLVDYDKSLRKIKSNLNMVNLFIKGEPFTRDFKLLDKEMLKIEELWQLPLKMKIDKSEKDIFNKIVHFLKSIYFKFLFFFLKPFRNRLVANNLASMNALKYLINSHKKLISDTDKLYRIIKELLVEMNKSIIDISEQQNYILKKISNSKKKI